MLDLLLLLFEIVISQVPQAYYMILLYTKTFNMMLKHLNQ